MNQGLEAKTKNQKKIIEIIQKSTKNKRLLLKKLKKVLQNPSKCKKVFIFSLFVINRLNKMQKPISDKIQLGENLNPARDYGGVSSINDEGTLEYILSKVDKAQSFIEKGKADGDLSSYYPNILPITRQSEIASELPRKAYASVPYSDKKQLEFVLDLTTSTYTNYSTMEVCVPLKITKKANKNQAIDDEMMTVNNFFRHWFTDIDLRRYPDDMLILPTNNSISIANYSNAQMKHLPEKSVKLCYILMQLST